MKITINVMKKHLYLISLLIAVFVLLTFATARYANTATGVGHDGDEIGVTVNGQNKVLNSVLDEVLDELSKRTTILVRHSQATSIPATPSGMTKLWDGYSYFGGLGYYDSIAAQDLGTTGSCLKEFRAMPFIECDSGNEKCDYQTGGDWSYWLSAQFGGTETLVDNMKPKVSRCAVFESSTPILVMHSQTTAVPSTPSGWIKIWDGYSYVFSHEGSGTFESQDLGTSGSCLPVLRPYPFAQCEWNRCIFGSDDNYGYWLATVSVDEGPVTGLENIRPKVSRCAVFTKS